MRFMFILNSLHNPLILINHQSNVWILKVPFHMPLSTCSFIKKNKLKHNFRRKKFKNPTNKSKRKSSLLTATIPSFFASNDHCNWYILPVAVYKFKKVYILSVEYNLNLSFTTFFVLQLIYKTWKDWIKFIILNWLRNPINRDSNHCVPFCPW